MVSQAACVAFGRAGTPGHSLKQPELTPKAALVTLLSAWDSLDSQQRWGRCSQLAHQQLYPKYGKRISPWDNYCVLAVSFDVVFSCFTNIHI